jgi:cytochrome d ubiquinol oxidase subunit I
MLFGMDRVGRGLHVTACVLVALGAVVSAFWILSANSWMQTPAGFTIADGKFQIANWWSAIFNPSFPYRFAHMVTAAYIAGDFVVIGVMGFYLWRGWHVEIAKAGFSAAMWIAIVLTPLQIFLGDAHGRNTLAYQPIKVAAMEGDWETKRGQPLVIFAWPNMGDQRNDYELAIPKLGSLILTHSWEGLVTGLKAAPTADQPPVPYVFYAFRLMVGIGVVMFLIALAGLVLRLSRRLYDTSWFAAICAFSSPLPFLAILCGWTVTEVGRQPYVVYGLLRTADAVSPLRPGAVVTSLVLFFIVYSVLLLAFFWYATRIVLRGPEIGEPAEHPMAVRPGKDSAPATQPAD